MKFARVIGKCDPKIVRECEDKLSAAFTELSLGWNNRSIGKSNLGGDPLVFSLTYPFPHILDCSALQVDEFEKKAEDIEKRLAAGEDVPKEDRLSDDDKKYFKKMAGRVLRTAATDGRQYFWAPEFLQKQSATGLRIVLQHESQHTFYTHMGRRGSRLPKLWNISADIKINFNIMQDLKAREIRDHAEMFTKHLGEFITLEEYASFLKDPFHPPPRLAHFNPTEGLKKMADPAYQDPFGDRPPMYYADSALSDDMKRPENIYDYLLAQIPKCPVCGKLGKYKKPDEYKALEKQVKDNEEKKRKEKEKQDKKNAKKGDKSKKGDPGAGASCNEPGHDHGEGSGEGDGEGENSSSGNGKPDPNASGQPQPGDGGSCCGGDQKGSCGCPGCGDDDSEYVDPFGVGDTLDDHIDSDVSEEEIAKRMTDAVEMAKRMAGKIPGGMEDELGILSSPQISVWDIIRTKLLKIRTGGGKSDWLRPKSKPMFAGLYVPNKKTYHLNFLCGFDTSGSMSTEDMAYGISQLQCIDDHGEGWIVGWDCAVAWNSMVKLRKADKENLSKAKAVGRGGTDVSALLNEYEEHCGKVDLLVIVTDGFLFDTELNNAKRPPKGTDTVWIITSHNPNFKPPFGRVFHLRGEKL